MIREKEKPPDALRHRGFCWRTRRDSNPRSSESEKKFWGLLRTENAVFARGLREMIEPNESNKVARKLHKCL